MADLGEGAGRPAPNPYFKTKVRPEGSKKLFLETAPPATPPPPSLSKGLEETNPPPLQVSWSIVKIAEHYKQLLDKVFVISGQAQGKCYHSTEGRGW